jgi:hypothetical protein
MVPQPLQIEAQSYRASIVGVDFSLAKLEDLCHS